MATFRLQPADLATLNLAADHAKKGGEAAAKACAKVWLTQGEGEAQTLAGYADESKHFLGTMIGGVVDLQRGHLDALKVGLQLYFDEVKKTREREQLQLIATEAADERLQELRDVARKLRLNIQLDLEDEAEAVGAEAGEG